MAGSPPTIASDGAPRLRVVREAKGRSLRQVAERAGVGRSNLSRWERGEAEPSPEGLERVLIALGIPSSERFSFAVLKSGDDQDPPCSMVSRRKLLRSTRLRNRLTLAEASRRIGVSKGALSRWESGDRWPGRDVLADAVNRLGAAELEVRAVASPGPLLGDEWTGPDQLADQITRLRGVVSTGAGDLDLRFIGLDEALSRDPDSEGRRLRLDLRAAYIEWLGWWYRDEEAGDLANRLIPKLNGHRDARVWGRVLRAASNYLSEVKRDPFASLDLLESTVPVLAGHSSEGFVRREIAGLLHSIGESEKALDEVRRARELSSEEEPFVHLYCCDMVETGIFSGLGRHDDALRILPRAGANDPYLLATSAQGRAQVLAAAGLKRQARASLSHALGEVESRRLPHFVRGLKRRLAELD